MRACAGLWLCLLLCGIGLAQPVLEPARTRVIIVGVLKWSEPHIPPFPVQGRQDQALYDTLVELGIPRSNMALLLDEAATGQAILEAFVRLKSESEPGDTLLFYYAGHGTRSSGVARFYEYDAALGRGFPVENLSEMIASNFRGDRVFLFADCCFSGALTQVSQQLQKRGFLSMALTSSEAELPSGSSWAYTMALISSLRGSREADHDINHRITVSELISEVRDNMSYRAGQRIGLSLDGMEPNLILSYVTSIETRPRLPSPFEPYQYVRLRQRVGWRGARLVGYQEPLVLAQIQGYSQWGVQRVPTRHLRVNPSAPEPSVGASAERRASKDGGYQTLLRRFRAEYDYLDTPPLYEAGYQEVTLFGQHQGLPNGYWVYLYPYWYIWKVQLRNSGGTQSTNQTPLAEQ